MRHDVKTKRADSDSTLPGDEVRWISSHPVAAGAVGGLVWGALLRLWMRYITPFPEFTWSGTLLILVATSVTGACLGAVWWHQRQGHSRRWRLLGLGGLLAFGGAGIIMLPSVLLGALGIGRQHWRTAIRAGLVVLALGGQYAFFAMDSEQIPSGRFVPAIAWYTVMITTEMWAFSILFRPRR